MGKKKTPEFDSSVPLTNLQHEKFCQLFVNGSDDTYNNATWSYAFAYDFKLDDLPQDDGIYENKQSNEDGKFYRVCVKPSSYKRAEAVCAVSGRKLLRTVKIQARIRKLFALALTDELADSELVKVIKQSKELAPKVSAIKEYNALKSRIANRFEVTGANGKDLMPGVDTITKSLDLIGKFINGRNTKTTNKGKS